MDELCTSVGRLSKVKLVQLSIIFLQIIAGLICLLDNYTRSENYLRPKPVENNGSFHKALQRWFHRNSSRT